ncbi:hypothetical protein GJAV_G00274340, partial [Gymnothorax javanicus]
PSPEASRLTQAFRRQGSAVAREAKKPDRVSEEAKARIVAAGGDPQCWQLVLSESELQFGQYWGQTFKWLLSHDVGYACAILASHAKEREGGDTTESPLAANKDALASYADLFPEVVAEVEQCRMREGSKSVRGMDHQLVGVAKYASLSFKTLYESTAGECRTYVQWLRTLQVQRGSRLHTLQAYVLGRDREAPAAATSATRPARRTTPQPSSRAAAADP